ncbi:hypothetical protein J8F10_25470 [Gemmata sp. G18]|uniref:Uncharacterized protein n=1 Tax=Gemmata palustris TaxID=2822762 RepID=A0ABS5BXZ2_9BACT|nr:hypothetical protein [Gemmata palustris]MBP3958612.1 hypothetical protein [Gemmata palustris]
MSRNSDDATDLTINLFQEVVQPPSIDPASLRRAMRYGARAQSQYRGREFCDVETELQAGWFLRGETAEWEWVRAAVCIGYEQGPEEV